MARRTLLLIASVLTAALGTALIWLYVQGAETRAEQGAELVPALFLTAETSAGQVLDGRVTTQAVPAAVAADAFTDASQVRGKTLKQPAAAGQIVLRSMVGEGAQTGRFPAKGAASITIQEPDRVPADLRVGDLVAVYAYKGGQAGELELIVDPIIVRSIGSATIPAAGTAAAGAGAQTAVPVTVIGFDASPEDVIKLYEMEASGARAKLYVHEQGVKAERP